MTIPAFVAHHTAVRTRLKIPSKRRDQGYFQRVAKALSNYPGIKELQTNPLTGSILIQHEEDVNYLAFAMFAQTHDLFALAQAEKSSVNIADRASLSLKDLDNKLEELSAGNLDLRSTLFVSLLALSGYQLTQGKVMAPAITLLWQAIEVLIHMEKEEKKTTGD